MKTMQAYTKADNPDKVGYEKAREELRQRKSWGGLADEVIDKLEALAIAEGERREAENREIKIAQYQRDWIEQQTKVIISDTRQQAFKEVFKEIDKLQAINHNGTDYVNLFINSDELKQAIDQLRNKGDK